MFLSDFLGALFYLVGTFFDKQLHLNTSFIKVNISKLKGAVTAVYKMKIMMTTTIMIMMMMSA